MASYLRPRRGKKSTAESQNIILKRGEVFFESPDTGVGTGAGKIKVGDGTTTYNNLPYFLEPTLVDVANTTIAFTEASSGVPATLLSALASGAKLNYIIGIIKKLLTLYNTSITNLQTSFQNGCSTIANAITANGVSTATNASPDTMATNISTLATNRYNAGVTATKVGTAVAANVLTGKTFTNSSGVGLSGSMVDRGAWTNTPTGSGNVTIPAGYHNGSGYVNTSTVYNNGYNAGAATGKKYVMANNVARTSPSGTYYINRYDLGGSPTTSIKNADNLHFISWQSITGGSWIPRMVRVTLVSKTPNISLKYVTLIHEVDRYIMFHTVTHNRAEGQNDYPLSSSVSTYYYTGTESDGLAKSLKMFTETGLIIPGYLSNISNYDFHVEAWG